MMASLQALRSGFHQSVLNIHLRSQGPEALQVLINGAASYVAPSRKNYFRMFILSQERSQKVIGAPDLLHRLIFHYKIVDISGI